MFDVWEHMNAEYPEEGLGYEKVDETKTYKDAGSFSTDDEDCWKDDSGDWDTDFKKSGVVINCPTCKREFRPLLSKFTKYWKGGSYYPAHSCSTGSITFFSIYVTYCRKCETDLKFTLRHDS